MNIRISTTIPEEVQKEAKKNKFKWNDLLITGFYARINNPNWQDRVRDSEEKIAKLTQKVADLSKNNWELQEKLRNLEENK